MELIHKELTDSVLGVFYRTYNRLGYGLLESVHANALTIELQRRGHRVRREVAVSIEYDGIIIGF
jgi:GxxExxY protein